MSEHVPDITPGGIANADFVAKMRADPLELQDKIPVDCKDCSSAWLFAFRGRANRLKDCPGREAETMEFAGKLVTQYFCHLPTSSKK